MDGLMVIIINIWYNAHMNIQSAKHGFVDVVLDPIHFEEFARDITQRISNVINVEKCGFKHIQVKRRIVGTNVHS